MSATQLQHELQCLADPAIALQSLRYFKTGPGQYGAGDKFLGIRVPTLRILAKRHSQEALSHLTQCLQSEFHEVRLFALLCLVYRYPRATPSEQQAIYDLYIQQRKHINNWDLVDTSAPSIIGAHLYSDKRDSLYQWAQSPSLWDRRIAVLATLYFIQHGDFNDTLTLADRLLADPEDLIHKALGWMLREVGKRDQTCLETFLQTRYQRMPRTMLRYAIEKLPEPRRQHYLKRNVEPRIRS